MKDGWYSLKTQREYAVNHFIFNDGESTLCRRAFTIKNLKDRISETDYEENSQFNCIICDRAFAKQINGEKRFIDAEREKHLPRVQRAIAKLNQIKLETHDKYRQVQTICPQCQTQVCFYSDGMPKEHFCTVCNNLVTLPGEFILA